MQFLVLNGSKVHFVMWQSLGINILKSIFPEKKHDGYRGRDLMSRIKEIIEHYARWCLISYVIET